MGFHLANIASGRTPDFSAIFARSYSRQRKKSLFRPLYDYKITSEHFYTEFDIPNLSYTMTTKILLFQVQYKNPLISTLIL